MALLLDLAAVLTGIALFYLMLILMFYTVFGGESIFESVTYDDLYRDKENDNGRDSRQVES